MGYNGKNLKTEISKKTKDTAVSDLFGDNSGEETIIFEGFDNIAENQTLNSGISDGVSGDISIQKSAFKENPF